MRNCDNCYWKRDLSNIFCVLTSDLKRPAENICYMHDYKCECCEDEKGTLNHKGKIYCFNCILEEFEIEEVQITKYYKDGCCLGYDDDIDEVIYNLEGVECIEEDY